MKTLKNPKTFIYYSQALDDGCQNSEDQNPTKKIKILIVLDNMIADM